MFVFCHYIVWIIMKGTHFTIRDEIVLMSNCIGCKFTSLKESVNYLFKHVTLTTYILVQCSHMYWVLVICTSITIVIFIHKCAKRILFKSVLCIPMCRLKHWNITEGCEHVCRLYLSVSSIKVTFLLKQVFLICIEYFLCPTNFLYKKNQPGSDIYLIKPLSFTGFDPAHPDQNSQLIVLIEWFLIPSKDIKNMQLHWV